MARGPHVPSESFACFECGKVLGYTTPGEARRINLRAHVFCAEHKNMKSLPTERQNEFMETARRLRSKGHDVTYALVGDELGISRSRAAQLAQAIRARGGSAELDAAFGFAPPPDEAEPTPVPQSKSQAKRLEALAEPEPPKIVDKRKRTTKRPAPVAEFSNGNPAAALSDEEWVV